MKIAVIGGGASGVLYALTVKKYHPEYDVTIFESTDKLLKRILVSGNGRCNFFNGNLLKNDLGNVYDNAYQARTIVDPQSAKETLDFLESLGVVSIQDSAKRLYPFSNTAMTIYQILLEAVVRYNVKVVYNARAKKIDNKSNTICFENGAKSHYDYLFIACGGDSYDRTNKANNSLIDSLGVPYVGFEPSLCPLKTKEKIPSYLVGNRFYAHLSLYLNNRVVYDEDGEIMIKKDGLSGIAIMDASLFYRPQDGVKFSIGLDLTKRGKDIVPDELLTKPMTFINEKLCNYILKTYGKNYVKNLKDLRFEIIDRYSFKESQVSRGGILLDSFDNKTMASNKDSNIAFGGEVINLTGVCGGYNLGLAFITGYKAGKSIK